MMKQLLASFLLVLFMSALTMTANAQDEKKEEKKEAKMEMAKSTMETGPVKSVTCDPACGFCVKSRSEKELISMVKMHAKRVHSKTMTDKDVKGMIKTEEDTGDKK